MLVDYGGRYFEKDSSDDSDMHSSDDEFDKSKGSGSKRPRKGALGGAKRKRKLT